MPPYPEETLFEVPPAPTLVGITLSVIRDPQEGFYLTAYHHHLFDGVAQCGSSTYPLLDENELWDVLTGILDGVHALRRTF